MTDRLTIDEVWAFFHYAQDRMFGAQGRGELCSESYWDGVRQGVKAGLRAYSRDDMEEGPFHIDRELLRPYMERGREMRKTIERVYGPAGRIADGRDDDCRTAAALGLAVGAA